MQLGAEQQTQLKNELLAMVQAEGAGQMRRKLCEVVSELARQLLDEEGNNLWPEFLRFLFDSASNGTPELKESALQMFGSVPGIFGNQVREATEMIAVEGYEATFGNQTSGLYGRGQFSLPFDKPRCDFFLVAVRGTNQESDFDKCLQQSQYLTVIKQMLQQCMHDQYHYAVRFQAVKSLSAFILLHDDDPGIQKHFQVLIGPLLASSFSPAIRR